MERKLTARQYDVLEGVTGGLRNAEIAAKLGITERTVKAYVGQLFLIFDVFNRTALTAKALQTDRGVKGSFKGIEPKVIALK
jgi:DNA-binding NarL/FixJ family response regulator